MTRVRIFSSTDSESPKRLRTGVDAPFAPSVRRVFKVHAPKMADTLTPDNFQRFVNSLNTELHEISRRIANIPDKLPADFNPENYVRFTELPDALDRLDEQQGQLLTSAEDNSVGGRPGSRRTSRRTIAQEEAQAALEGAIPTNAPPPIQAVGKVGTTTDPPLFALSDHTHAGSRSQFIALPLRAGITLASTTVTAATSRPDLAYRRHFLTMARRSA